MLDALVSHRRPTHEASSGFVRPGQAVFRGWRAAKAVEILEDAGHFILATQAS